MKFTFFALATLFFASAAYPVDYTLMCKGGSGLYGNFSFQNPQAPYYGADIHFKPGQVAATPGLGECVWVDRGMRPTEPTRIFYTFPFTKYEDAQSFFVTHNGPVVGNGPLKYLIEGLKNGKSFQLRVENSGKGYFVVKHLGP